MAPAEPGKHGAPIAKWLLFPILIAARQISRVRIPASPRGGTNIPLRANYVPFRADLGLRTVAP
jgi:hypothetical protein